MKRSKRSLMKIKIMILLMMVTMLFAITATYAWFSSQRDLDITGIKLNVEVAESMQISLDGERWVQSITIDNMRQFYGTYSVTSLHQANKNDNTNYVPTELKPVSTIGEVFEGKLLFMKGNAVKNGITTSVAATPCSEEDLLKTATITERENGNDNHPYLAFDMYLRNYSAKESDVLQLNEGSRVWVDATTTASQEGKGKEGTGLENCVRVGFVVYENTADITASGSEIRNLTSSGINAQVSIWEPNWAEHIQEVLNNSSRAQANTWAGTYGIRYSETEVTVDDVEATSGENIARQRSMLGEYAHSSVEFDLGYERGEKIYPENMRDTNYSEIMLEGNKITKVRVYIWLEGQDVDCINTASQGDRLQATIKLTKPYNIDDSDNTYTGEETTLSASRIKATDFGGYVTNYTVPNVTNDELGIGGWRIFNSDGENIYLIADKHIFGKYVPNSTNSVSKYFNSSQMEDLLISYTKELRDVPETVAKKWFTLKAMLNQEVFDYEECSFADVATAYLLDVDLWSHLVNESYAEYAIGGPTLELFVNSYNKVYKDKTIKLMKYVGTYVYEDEETGTNLTIGYADYVPYWANGDQMEDNMMRLQGRGSNLYVMDSSDDLNFGGTFIGDLGDEYGALWFAYDGGRFSTVLGLPGEEWRYDFRPVIALKSDVRLEKHDDGTYTIVE